MDPYPPCIKNLATTKTLQFNPQFKTEIKVEAHNQIPERWSYRTEKSQYQTPKHPPNSKFQIPVP